MTDRVERRDEVDADDRLPFAGRELIDRRDVLNAGVVHQDVDRAELFVGFPDHRFDRSRIGHVGRVVAHGDAVLCLEPRPNRFDLIEASQAVQYDIRTRSSVFLGDAETDSAGGAGNERSLALEHRDTGQTLRSSRLKSFGYTTLSPCENIHAMSSLLMYSGLVPFAAHRSSTMIWRLTSDA